VQPVDDRGRAVEKLLAGRYEILGFLGRGGFASVYQVRSASLQRFEALKVLHETHGEDSDFAKRFRLESRVAASLEHPSIVKIYDFGLVQGVLWYSMQFVDGLTLSGELDRRKTFDEETAARIAVPLLDALDYSHARGIVHRDIKPDNVLLDNRGRPFLMDFGIAKTGDSLVKTQTGFILGSPAYLSPEQLRGLPLDGRTDVYSLGATLYQMLAGVVPYRTESMSALGRRLTEDAPPLSGRRAGIHPELERIVHKSLARDRDARYLNAAEMRDDLESFLAEVHPRAARVRAGSNEAPGFGPTTATPTASAAPTAALAPPSAAALAASRAMMPEAPSSPVLTETASTRTSSTRAESFEAAPERKPRRWPWALAGVAILLLAAAGGWLLTRQPVREQIPIAPPARATSVPTAVPTSVPTAVPTAIPTAPPTPVPTVAAPSVQAPAPTAIPAPTRRPTPSLRRTPRESSASAPTPTLGETRATTRRATTQAALEEEAPLLLSPAQQRACGGRAVGISVVVAEDGTLKNKHVISSVSTECDAIALEAISRNRYRPALDKEGRPVESRFVLSVPF
jgi:eukaryotic-like serine/threonine-protein kinase